MSGSGEILTAEQRAALEAELADLEGPRRAAAVEAIATARSFGDLSENFEYHAAKNEQGLLEARIAKLRDRIQTAVVVTRTAGWSAADDGVLVAPGVAEAIALAATVDEEVFVVGGSRVYEAALPLADKLELTWVDAEPEGDARFPAVDWDAWREVAREEHEGWAAVSYERAG